ncbi:MAG: DUF1848 domain-containing protein [Erysipelotrichaceae bacterium]|nr:DUF1848 domain-containing protein [Erysipelotrichaceae bacterium]
MILNTGSRTDIPAFYSEWFMNRIREGFVLVRNPYYPKQTTRYELDPSVVDVLVFCTKDPFNMLRYIDELKKFRMYWNVTITPYGKDIEPNLRQKKDIMDSFIELSKKIKSDHIAWRYDPIFLNEKYNKEYHLMIFEKMCAYLKGYTDTVIISFIDLYEKTKKNFPSVKEVSYEDQCDLCQNFTDIVSRYGMRIKTCLENEGLKNYGADVSGCLTKETLEKATGLDLNVKDLSYARQGCKCLLGNDIGAYNTCMHLCKYCYANYDEKIVRDNFRKHDPKSPLLIGNIEEGDIVKNAKQISYINDQTRLF